MEATELRIGNYVYTQSGKLVVNRDSIYKVENVNMQSARKYEPIPLTEEWLLKFEFEGSLSNWYGKKYFTDCEETPEIMKIDYNLKSNRLAIIDISDELDDTTFPIYTAKTIKYVHQLQNVYFALTGEELTIKN